MPALVTVASYTARVRTAPHLSLSPGTGTGGKHVDHQQLGERAQRSLSATPRPFLRWAGSKQRLLPHLVPLLPSTFARYFEPFLGGASLFFLLEPQRALLADISVDLIDTYEAVRDGPRHVLRFLRGLDPLDREMYYRIRKNRSTGRYKRAAQFLYLNRAGWNGLYRVNSRGEFNVPYGAPRSANLVDTTNLHACARILSGGDVEVRLQDFEESLRDCGPGDFAFLDPPYVTGHNNNGFIDYNNRLFQWTDQERLASIASDLANRGVKVLVTNAHHDAVLALYPGFTVHPIDRPSTLAGQANRRGPVREVALRSYE